MNNSHEHGRHSVTWFTYILLESLMHWRIISFHMVLGRGKFLSAVRKITNCSEYTYANKHKVLCELILSFLWEWHLQWIRSEPTENQPGWQLSGKLFKNTGCCLVSRMLVTPTLSLLSRVETVKLIWRMAVKGAWCVTFLGNCNIVKMLPEMCFLFMTWFMAQGLFSCWYWFFSHWCSVCFLIAKWLHKWTLQV